MILGKSIYQLNGKLLLGAGFRISQQMKAKLIERGYTHVYIHEEGTEEVEPEEIVSEQVGFEARSQLAGKIFDIQNQKDFKNASAAKVSDMLDDGSLRDTNITGDMRRIVEEILKDISAAGAKVLNTVMIKTADTMFLDHALNTAVLSIMIGRRYRFSQKELLSLGLGAFLHDIGKIVIQQMNKNTDPAKSKELYKEHSTYGYMILNNQPGVSPLETQIVNQHHEQQNGKGFPTGLKGQNLPPTKSVDRVTKGHIFRLAEVVSVANAFDNLSFNPNDREENDPIQAVKEIILKAGTVYNKDIVKMLLTVVPYYPVGATIKVIDILDPALIGYIGVVAKLHNENINKPTIILTQNRFKKKIKPIVIDTMKLKKVVLKLVV